MVRQWQQVFYNERYSSTLLPEFDFIGFAKSCGADGVTVRECSELADALERAQKSDKPFLIEVVIDKADLVMPMVAPGAKIDDFGEARSDERRVG